MTREQRLELLKQIEKDIYVPSIESTLLDDVKSCAIHSAIEELEQEPCEDAIGRKEVTQSRPEWLSEDVERNTDEQTVVDRAFNRGWNSCLKEFLKNIKELPSIIPQPKTGHWIKQDNIKEPLYGWYFCSECNSVIGGKTKFCSNCGAKMEGKE